MLLYWIWLAQKTKVSCHLKQVLLQRFSAPEDIYYASPEMFGEIPGMTAEAAAALEDKDLTEAQEILRVCQQKGIRILTCADAAYPNRLRNTYDPPVLLYCKGILPDWEAFPVIGIVGTRKATTYGMNTARQFGATIAACGALVVSGGASGIDTMAMQGALDAGKPVMAVLGGGVDVVYPAKNRRLFQLVETTGCLLSEYPPGEAPLAWHFPQRNRILTGISNGLLVVEAPEKSGALISAHHAMEQGRDVFVVPGNVGVEACAGSNALLDEQAIPALSGWHVVREYAALYPDTVRRQDLPAVVEKSWEKVAQEQIVPENSGVQNRTADKKSIDKDEKSTYSVLNNPPADLDSAQQRVLAQIRKEPITVDDVIAQADMPSGTVKSILTKLAIKGLIRNHPGGRVSLK